MASFPTANSSRPMAAIPRPKTIVRHEGASGEASSSADRQVAHTLTACTRCRARKTRCDPTLPRCSPCERTNSTCEYYDSNRGTTVNRNYVVYLQHKVRELEEEVEKVENEDSSEDPEAMMRAATVRVHDAQESKYLGPSSGIAITRLVMQLAKTFTDAKSIKEIVPEHRARQIKELYHQEQAKPTSKIYPLISDVAAIELPSRVLTDLLVQLYKLKVQPMYPALHEPTLDNDISAVYGDQGAPPPTSFQSFETRMVIAISLQKMDTQYAGLADSYYLAALNYLDSVVRPMDLKTLQCFALMAEYSLLTPTRTAIYYVTGIAIRLVQALGFHEEKTVTRGRADGKTDYLEIDMRRRLFWCIIVMDYGLAHSLGRPAMMATSHEHIDVGWFETCDDIHIKPDGIDPEAQRPTLKKWIAIHFFKMRLLQLEIRRKLYQRKRPEPVSDSDPWFQYMDAKLCAWRDAAPNNDEGIGLDKKWFVGRYYTMVVFLYRPSPQVARPTVEAALKCFEACEYMIYMQRAQITNKNVDLTWIFTQTVFMTINTLLWSLSYVEVRRKHNRAAVEAHLEVAMDAIQLASERWPGVASAVQLYHNLINAVLQIYEKDDDVPIAATTPSEMASPPSLFPDAFTRGDTTSPATVSNSSIATPPAADRAPFGYFQQQARRSIEQPPPMPYSSELGGQPGMGAPQMSPPGMQLHMQHPVGNGRPSNYGQQPPFAPQMPFDPNSYANALPELLPGLNIPTWPAPQQQYLGYPHQAPQPSQSMYNAYADPAFDPSNQAYPFPGQQDPNAGEQWMNQYWNMDVGNLGGGGLNLDQQQELMHMVETEGMEDIQSMISSTLSSLTPKQPQRPTF